MSTSDSGDEYDDDSDNEVGSSSLTEFNEEISSLLRSSLTDRATFKSIIAEVEHVRYAYDQDATVLNKTVLKTLFELPFHQHGGSNLEFKVYINKMNQLFDTYSPLMKSLKRDQKTKQEGAEAVTEPLVRLFLERKLAPGEWSEANGKNLLADLLRLHDVVSESQINIVIQNVDAKISQIPVQQQPQPLPPILITGAGAGACAGGGAVEQNRLSKRKHHSNLSTGRFSGTFDHRGGKLCHWMSNNYLEITEGAIPVGQQWTIHGEIHTSLDDYVRLLKRRRGEVCERFIAPINEYKVEGGHHFEKPVKVVIHHAITNQADISQLSIQLEDDFGLVDVLPCRPTNRSAKEPWYEVDGSRITVFTYHFTNIVCKICIHSDDNQCKVIQAKGLVYGKMANDANNTMCATLEVYVHFRHAVEMQSVFDQVFAKDQENMGMRLLSSKAFPPALREILPTDVISVELLHTNPKWQLLEGFGGSQKKEFLISNYISCLTEVYDPVSLGTYMLQGSDLSINGVVKLSLRGKYETILPLSLQCETASTGSQNVLQSSSSSKWIYEDSELFEIAEKINYKTIDRIGVELKFTLDEMDNFQANSGNASVERKICDILRFWRDRQEPRTSEQAQKSKEHLRSVLAKTFNYNAVEMLKNIDAR